MREFVLCAHGVEVAPVDFAFRGSGHPTQPPDLPGVALLPLSEFEALWERWVQPRLGEVAALGGWASRERGTCYFRTPFPSELKEGEASSTIYAEYAGGFCRRTFEVFPHDTCVSPYDCGIAENGTEDMLRYAWEGVDADGDQIDPRLRPEEIEHVDFETQWEHHALPRLRRLAQLLLT